MAKLVAGTYSEALFDVALETGKTETFLEELQGVLAAFEAHPRFYELFRTPQINIEEKKAIMEEVFGGRVSQEVMNFLKIIMDKQRGSDIEAIVRAYGERVYAHEGIEKATAVTAVPLSAEQMEALSAKLGTLTGKKIELTNKVDEAILGGVTVRIGDRVIDGSIRNRLEDLREDLARLVV